MLLFILRLGEEAKKLLEQGFKCETGEYNDDEKHLQNLLVIIESYW